MASSVFAPASERQPLSAHLKSLEAESIHIIREVAAAFDAAWSAWALKTYPKK